jgi:hypothetical protein
MEPALADLQLEPQDIKDGILRKIYYNVEYEPKELDWIQQMKDAVAEANLTLPEFIDDATLLKNAESTMGNIKKSVKLLQEFINWRLNELPVEVAEVE